MSGLNDNFLIADDSMEPKTAPAVTIKAFKEEDGDEPELRDDIDLIAVATEELTINLRDLEILTDRYRDAGGISQSLALESLDTLPTLITDERPVEFFTKHPSRTMLSAALEEVEEKKKGILDKFKAFIVNMFKRLVDWFKNMFSGEKVKELDTPENAEALKNVKATVEKTAAAAKAAEPAANARMDAINKNIEAFKAKQAAQQAEAKAGAEKEAKLKKLQDYVQSLKNGQFGAGVMTRQINIMLSKLPHVRKILANLNEVNPLLFAHRTSTHSVNSLITDIQKAVDHSDYQALQQIMSSNDFTALREEGDKLAQAVVDFRALPGDYDAPSLDKFLMVADGARFFAAFAFGESLLKHGLKESIATTDAMEKLSKSLYQMELYKWGKDAEAEAIAKKFLEELKTLNQQVIVPMANRLSFSFSVVKQLVVFCSGVDQLVVTLNKAIDDSLKQLVLTKAKELGIEETEALQYLK